MSLFLKRLLVQISMVSSRRMLVKRESISKLPITLLESCSTISVAKLNESFTVYLLVVNGSKIGTKFFANLYVSVCKADKIGLKGGQPSTYFLCTLQEPHIIPGLTTHYSRSSCHWFHLSSCFFDHAVRVKKLFINFINAFFLTGNKIQEIVIFYSSFLKFFLFT